MLADGYENDALCDHCRPKEGILYLQEINHHRHLENRFSELFTECQRCMGSLHEEILCTSRDCPIFYIRKKVQMELDSSSKRIVRFQELAIQD